MLPHTCYLLVIVDGVMVSTVGVSVTGCAAEIGISMINPYTKLVQGNMLHLDLFITDQMYICR